MNTLTHRETVRCLFYIMQSTQILPSELGLISLFLSTVGRGLQGSAVYEKLPSIYALHVARYANTANRIVAFFYFCEISKIMTLTDENVCYGIIFNKNPVLLCIPLNTQNPMSASRPLHLAHTLVLPSHGAYIVAMKSFALLHRTCDSQQMKAQRTNTYHTKAIRSIFSSV